MTTALGDLEMLEKIVVLRMHADRLRVLNGQEKTAVITRATYDSEARGLGGIHVSGEIACTRRLQLDLRLIEGRFNAPNPVTELEPL